MIIQKLEKSNGLVWASKKTEIKVLGRIRFQSKGYYFKEGKNVADKNDEFSIAKVYVIENGEIIGDIKVNHVKDDALIEVVGIIKTGLYKDDN